MRCLIASLPALALACGGSIHPIDPNALQIEGSYDFTVSTFNVTDQQGCCMPPPTSTHPAIGQHARLDIRKSGAGYEAYVTPDFADPSQMTVVYEQDGNVTLQGQVNFNGPTDVSYASASDELAAIHLAVGADGHLAGTFTAEGQENVFEGDVGWNGQATASGAIGHDARPPISKPAVIASAPGVVLPWDALYARISEPVDATAFTNALGLAPSSGAALTSWQLGSTVDWLGGVSVTGYRTSWSDFTGPATFSVAGGLVDPSNNVSSTSATPVQYLDVPKAATFSGGTLPALWGAAQAASSPDACGTASACVEIGPITGPCSSDSGGIAGRLASGSTLSLTFRARTTSQYGQPYMMGPLGISVAAPGKAAQTLSDPSLDLKFSATNDPNYPYATDWITAKVALPVSGSEIGFAVLPFANESMYCGGGPAIMPMTLVLDVAEVTTLP